MSIRERNQETSNQGCCALTLEKGMTVLHKTFGYSEVSTFEDMTVDVVFDSDDSKTRKFMFLACFTRGCCRLD